MRLKKWMLIVLLGTQVKQACASEPDRLKTPDEIVVTKEQLFALGYKLSDDRSLTINNAGFLVGSLASLALPKQSQDSLPCAVLCLVVIHFAKTHFKPTTENFCNKFLCTFVSQELLKLVPMKNSTLKSFKQAVLVAAATATGAVAAYDYTFPKIKAQKEKSLNDNVYGYDEMTLQKMFWSDKFQALDAKISLRK